MFTFIGMSVIAQSLAIFTLKVFNEMKKNQISLKLKVVSSNEKDNQVIFLCKIIQLHFKISKNT